MKKIRKILALVLSVMMLSSMCAVEMIASAEEPVTEVKAYTVLDSSKDMVTMVDGSAISELGATYGATSVATHGIEFNRDATANASGMATAYTNGTANITNSENINANIKGDGRLKATNPYDLALYLKSKTLEETQFAYQSGTTWVFPNTVTLYSVSGAESKYWKKYGNHIIEFDVKADNTNGEFGVHGWNLWQGAGRTVLLNSDGKINGTNVDYPIGEWFRLRLEYHTDDEKNYWNIYMTKYNSDGSVKEVIPVVIDTYCENNPDAWYGSNFATIFTMRQIAGASDYAGYSIDNFKHITGTPVSSEQIVSPAAEQVCDEATVKFEAITKNAAIVKFRLDGKLMETFTAENTTDLFKYTTYLDMSSASYGIHDFAVEKFDADGKLIGIIKRTVNLVPLYQDFLKVYPTSLTNSPYNYFELDKDGDGAIADTEKGYPLEKRAVKDFAPNGQANPYVFELIKTTNGYCAYEDTDNDGINDVIHLKHTTATGAWAMGKHFIKLTNKNTALNTDGGIIELDFTIKPDNNNTTINLVGLPMWTNNTNVIINHYFISGGVIYGTDVTVEPDVWTNIKLHHDIDNKTWKIWKNGKYVATIPFATTNASSTTYRLYDHIQLTLTDNKSGNLSGFMLKEVGISRLKKAPAVGINNVVEGTNIAQSTQNITFTLDKGYDALTDADVKFIYNGTEKTVSGINYTSGATSLTVPVPEDVTLAHGDKVYLAIKPAAEINMMDVNKEIGANLTVYEEVFKLKDFAVDGTDATVNVYNGVNEAKSGKLYIASYNSENELVGLYTSNTDFTADALSLDNIVNQTVIEGSYYKVMYWNGTTLAPLAVFVDYTVPVQE